MRMGLDKSDLDDVRRMRGNRDRLVLILAGMIGILFFSLLEGIIWFLTSAAAGGFLSWLCGAHAPREWALGSGVVVGTPVLLFSIGSGIRRLWLEADDGSLRGR